MSHKPNAVPVLQEGTVYTIILDNGRKVHDVIYHACVASGKSYFAKGDKTYPAEKVRNHSITGHAASDGSRRNGTPNPDRFAITDEVCEVVDVVTTPETNPEGYKGSDLKQKAGNLKGRLEIIIGGTDPTCVPQHTYTFLRACINAGTHPDLFIYPEDGHNMVGRDRVHLHEHITRYFEDHLK